MVTLRLRPDSCPKASATRSARGVECGSRLRALWPAVLLAALAGACASSSGGKSGVVPHFRDVAGIRSGYSDDVKKTLAEHKLAKAAPAEAAQGIEALAAKGDPTLWLQAAEIRLLLGTEEGFLLGARDVWRWMEKTRIGEGRGDAEHERARRLYNHCCAGYFVSRGESGKLLEPAKGSGLAMRVSAPRGYLAECDDFRPAYGVTSSHLWTDVRTKGWGGPVLAIARYQKAKPQPRPYLPKVDMAWGYTAFLRFGNGGTEFSLHDPKTTTRVPALGKSLRLEARYTAPYAYVVNQARSFGATSLVQSRSALEKDGFWIIDPPDPDRIPVLLVHGLRSSAQAWVNLVNELQRDPEIRRRYRFIYYNYSTGFPLALIKVDFSRRIEKFWSWYDQQAPGGRAKGYVAVGHSMGGLVIKSLGQDDHTVVWNTLFTKPADEVDLSTLAGGIARRAFILESDPHLARLVFMSTPHRGAPMAENVIGWIGRAVSTESPEIREFRTEVEGEFAPITKPALKKLMARKISSIDNLKEDDPYLLAMASVPIREGLPFHTIIGDHHGNLTNPQTDGVVPYESAHLDGATSEKVIKSGHSSEETSAGIAEVRRILLVHAKSVAR